MAEQSHLSVEGGDANDIAPIPSDPRRVDRIAEQCESVGEVVQNREYKVVDAEYEGVSLTISSTGTDYPSVAIAIEELARVGVETFIRVGTVGVLQTNTEAGDTIVITGAAKKEGTSRRHESEMYPAVPDYDMLTSLVDSAGVNGKDVHVDPIVSDDASYNGSGEYVKDWSDAGLLAIEMEAATVFSLARHRGLRAGAICTVDSNLVVGMQRGIDSDEELPEKAKSNVERAISISLDAVADLA